MKSVLLGGPLCTNVTVECLKRQRCTVQPVPKAKSQSPLSESFEYAGHNSYCARFFVACYLLKLAAALL